MDPTTQRREPRSETDPRAERDVEVVAAVIERDGRLLVCERPPHKRHEGLWEFPGGKIEDGEEFLDAARRELAEELGVEVVSVGEVLLSVRDPGSVFLIQFAPVEIRGEPEALEHSRLAWVHREALMDLQLAPSDRRFAETLLQGKPPHSPSRTYASKIGDGNEP